MRRAHRSSLPGLIVIALVLCSLGAAAARGEDPPLETSCPEGLVYDAAGDICVLPENLPPAGEEPPVDEGEPPVDEMPTEMPIDEGEEPVEEEPTEAPMDEGEEQPAVDPGQQLVGEDVAGGPIGGLTLDGYFCPFGTDDTIGEQALIIVCTEGGLNGFEFTAIRDGAVVSTQPGPTGATAVDFQNGLATPLVSGAYVIGVTPAPGYDDESYLVCTITSAEGAVRNVEYTLLSATVLELGPGETAHCNLFNVEAEPRPGPALGIQLVFQTCPEGYVEGVTTGVECNLPLPGPVTFDFIRDGQVVESGTAAPPATELRFTGNGGMPESGEWTIRPNLPAGWIDPYITCAGLDAAGARQLNFEYRDPADGGLGVTAKFGPNQLLQCMVTFYAGDLSKSVAVTTRPCPDGFDAVTAAPADRNAACHKTQFYPVAHAVDEAAPVQGESARNGQVVFPAQPGQWRITVEPNTAGLEGRAVTFVTCNHTLAALGQVQTIEPTINSDGRSITMDLDEGDALSCEFFMGTAPAAAAEAPAPAPAEEPAADTTAPDAGTTGDTTNPTSTNTGAGASETAPEGGTGSFGGGGEAVQVVDTGTQPGAPEGAAPSDPAATGTASLAIQHWDCPAAIAPEATADSLIETCTASLQPSAWTLNGTPLDAADGYAVWPSVPLETVNVGSGAATGKDDAASAVYCSLALTDVDESLIGVEAAVRGGAIELVFDQPSAVYCNWFVAP